MTPLRRDLPRRAFLKISLWASGALGLYGVGRFLSREEPSPAPQQVIAGYPAEYPVDAMTPIPEARAVLIHDEDGFYAISASCTHLGCTLGTEVSPLECPCHGSRFNEQGLVIHGPASRPLLAFELSLTSDGRILIDCNTPAPIDQRLPAAA